LLRLDKSVDMIEILVKTVETQFVVKPQADQDECCQAYRKPENIDKSISFLTDNATDCCCKIVLKHTLSIFDKVISNLVNETTKIMKRYSPKVFFDGKMSSGIHEPGLKMYQKLKECG
jgi:hypothetical protein